MQGFKEQTQRLLATQTELANARKDLTESYLQSSKHAQQLYQYIEQAKETETRLLRTNLALDDAAHKNKILQQRLLHAENDAKQKGDAIEVLKSEYRSLQEAYRTLEGRLKEQSDSTYNVREKSDSDQRKHEKMEEQIFASAKIIGDLTEEIAGLHRALHDLRNAQKTGEALVGSPLGSNPLFTVKPSSLDGESICMAIFDQPPTTKHRSIEAHPDAITQLRYNAQGTVLASCSNDKTVKTWSALSGRLSRTYLGSTKSVRCVEFSIDGRLVVAGSSGWNFSMR